MVLSNEHIHYKLGAYKMRVENLISKKSVVIDAVNSEMLELDILTVVYRQKPD